jgi:hypothetical protein
MCRGTRDNVGGGQSLPHADARVPMNRNIALLVQYGRRNSICWCDHLPEGFLLTPLDTERVRSLASLSVPDHISKKHSG